MIDRFEGDVAVVLVGENERRLEIPRKSLPRGVREGAWLQIEVEGDRLVSAMIDQAETDLARQRIQEELDRLRRGEHLR